MGQRTIGVPVSTCKGQKPELVRNYDLAKSPPYPMTLGLERTDGLRGLRFRVPDVVSFIDHYALFRCDSMRSVIDTRSLARRPQPMHTFHFTPNKPESVLAFFFAGACPVFRFQSPVTISYVVRTTSHLAIEAAVAPRPSP